MSNAPSTDTDPWDRPLDVSEEWNVPFTGAHANHRTVAERLSPHVIKLLHHQAPSPMTGMKHPRRRKTTREYGTTRATSSHEPITCSGLNYHRRRNKKVPMPQLVVTSSRMGSIPNVVPPASAFQSPIRILKRSAAPTQTCASDDSSASATSGTFAERSARYNAARERIFAGTKEASESSGEGVPVSAIIRNPKGPEHAKGLNGQDTEGSQGFGVRAGKRGGSSQQQGQQLQDLDLKTE